MKGAYRAVVHHGPFREEEERVEHGKGARAWLVDRAEDGSAVGGELREGVHHGLSLEAVEAGRRLVQENNAAHAKTKNRTQSVCHKSKPDDEKLETYKRAFKIIFIAR